jgi:hypothetical protein
LPLVSPSGQDSSHFATGVTNVPQPSMEGRSMVGRMANQLLGRNITPRSGRWSPQVCSYVRGRNKRNHYKGRCKTLLHKALEALKKCVSMVGRVANQLLGRNIMPRSGRWSPQVCSYVRKEQE